MSFTARPDIANQVFGTHGSKFCQRLGVDWGLRQLGMKDRGVIWNNTYMHWNTVRKVFTDGVQCSKVLHATVRASVEAAQYTLAAALNAAGRQLPPALPAGPGQTPVALHVLEAFRLITLRVTLQVALGLPLAALSHQEAQHVVDCVTGYFQAWLYFLHQPCWMAHLRNWVPSRLPGGAWGELRRQRQRVAALRSAVRLILERVKQYEAAGKLCSEPCGLFLRHLRQEVQDAEQQAQAVLEVVLAGTDTSSVTLSWLPVQWAQAGSEAHNTPDLQQLVYEEVAAALQGSTDGLAAGSWQEQLAQLSPARLAEKLPLLDACLRESMRFKPVGPVVIRQAGAPPAEPAGDAQRPGHLDSSASSWQLGLATAGPALTVRPGHTVVVDLATMGLDPSVFPNPHTFDPHSNFLTNSRVRMANTRGVETPNFMPFGYGRKSCVGYKLAEVEMRAIMAAFVMTLEVTGGPCTSLQDQPVRWDIASQPVDDIVIHVRPRLPLTCGPQPAAAAPAPTQPPTSACSGSCQPQRIILSRAVASSNRNSSSTAAPAGPEPHTGGLPHGGSSIAGQLLPSPQQLTVTFCGPHGSGKTTLCQALRRHPALAGIQVQVVTEVARQLLRDWGWCQQDLQDDGHFLQLQQAIICKLASQACPATGPDGLLAAAVASACDAPGWEHPAARAAALRLCDRGVIDALAYTAWRFGFNSPEYKQVAAMPEAQALLVQHSQPDHLLVLVPPFSHEEPETDGVRLTHDAQGLCEAFRQVLGQQGLHYCELATTGVAERASEVLALLRRRMPDLSLGQA